MIHQETLNKFESLKNEFENLQRETQSMQFYKASRLMSNQILATYLLSLEKVAKNYEKDHEDRIEAEEQKLVVENIKNLLDVFFKSKGDEEGEIEKDITEVNALINLLNIGIESLNEKTTDSVYEKKYVDVKNNFDKLESAITRIKKNKRRIKSDEMAIFQLQSKVRKYTINNEDKVDLLKFEQLEGLEKSQTVTRNKQKDIEIQKELIRQEYLNKHTEFNNNNQLSSISLLYSDTESCYSDTEENLDININEQRMLTISFDHKSDKKSKDTVTRAIKNQKKYYDTKGFEQKFIKILPLDKALKRSAFNSDLKNKLKWVCKADQFVLNVISHGDTIDKNPDYDAKNLVKVLMLHGLNKDDYEQKGTLTLQSCESGLWSSQRAVNELKLYRIGGLKVEGFNHLIRINKYSVPTQHPLKKRKLHAGQYGETLVNVGFGRCENARSKNLDGQYKYLNSITIPPAKELKTKKRKKGIRNP